VVCGDGSFQMSMNELAAVKACGMDLKIVLMRNGVLGLVRQSQVKAPYHGPFGVDLQGDPDFAAVAAAYGIPSIILREEADVESALDQFLGREGPCLLIAETGSGYMTTD
jgi:acetolactate synthase-1/2/3 large subunit